LSRSESLEETGKIIQKIEETGTNIITANDSRNISKKDISETFMTDITIIKAKHERLDIKQRSMNGSIRKLEQ